MTDALDRDALIELGFLMRNAKPRALGRALQSVSAGCEKIREHKRFDSMEEALDFIRCYALVRDVAHAATKYAEHLQVYAISESHLSQCLEVYHFIEKSRSEARTKSGSQLFNGKPAAPVFGRKELDELFSLFAPIQNRDLRPG